MAGPVRTSEMVTDPTGAVGTTIELPDRAAKKGSGRKVPLHGDLRRALTGLRAVTQGTGPIVSRGGRWDSNLSGPILSERVAAR